MVAIKYKTVAGKGGPEHGELVSDSELEIIRQMNNATVPACNELTMTMLKGILDEAFVFQVAVEEGSDEIVGFIIAFTSGKAYTSPNYQFFQKKYGQGGFVYVDRIVVGPKFHRKGVGRTLYARVVELSAVMLAAAGVDPQKMSLCCEVNLQPPNPESVEFHAKLGFDSVGVQETEGGAKQVTLLVRAFNMERLCQ